MREGTWLRERYRAILGSVGLILGLAGLLMLTPLVLAVSAPFDARQVTAFLAPALGSMAAGFGLWRRLDHRKVDLTLEEGGVIVVLSWILVPVISAIPLLLIERLTPTQALFESVSGWTTTGLSVLDVSRSHPATLLWRSTMQLAGGAGLAIILLASIAGSGGPSLSAAEGRTEQLAPQVRTSAILVVRVYAGLVLFGVLLLRAVGMTVFDAVNHAFCALSTGGFSTHAESIGYWNSPRVEGAVIVLMIAGNLSFVTLWLLVRGRWRSVGRNGEIRVMAVLLPVAATALLVATCVSLYPSLSKAVRVAVFESVTALTTTGYSTVAYTNWNSFGILILIVLMLIGGGTCSTAGGIKQFRVHLLARSVYRDVRRAFLPRAAVPAERIWEGEEWASITPVRVGAAGTFVFLYVTTWLLGSAAVAACGYALPDALFEFGSALGTVGLSVGVTGPGTGAPVLWIEIVGMLLGRLEFFVVVIGIVKVGRDLVRMLRRSGEER